MLRLTLSTLVNFGLFNLFPLGYSENLDDLEGSG